MSVRRAPPGRHGPRSRREREAVLLLGNYIPSLAAARSVAASGYRVVAGDGGEYSAVRYSRDCHERWEHPPIRGSEAFLAALSSFLERRQDIRVVLPLQPRYVELIARSRQRLPAGRVLATPPADVVLACLDKDRMYALAREEAVPHHPVTVVHDIEALMLATAAIGYPCVIRPQSDSGLRLPGDRKALICRDERTVRRMVGSWPPGHHGLLVQRYAPGGRINVFFAARDGRVLARVHTRILRTDRPDGTGVAVEGITVPRDERLDLYTDALIRRLGYRGVGFAQFIVPERDDPHFLEINPRHAGSTAVPAHAGLDLVAAAIGLASEPVAWDAPAGWDYRIGQRYAWTSRDLYGLGSALSRHEIGTRGAASWLTDAIGAAVRADLHLSWSIRDPLPTFAVYAHLATFGPRRRVARGRPGDA